MVERKSSSARHRAKICSGIGEAFMHSVQRLGRISQWCDSIILPFEKQRGGGRLDVYLAWCPGNGCWCGRRSSLAMISRRIFLRDIALVLLACLDGGTLLSLDIGLR